MTDVPLKHICSLPPEYGLNITPDRYRDEGVRLLRTSDIATGGVVRDSGGVFLDPVDVPAELLLRDGDLLFSRSGTLGRALLYRQDEPGEATFAGFLVRFRLRRGVDPRAIRYWSESAPFIGTVASEAIQSTISNFNADRYANLAVPAWLVEQSAAIADYLDAETTRIDTLTSRYGELVELLVEQRDAITVAGVSGESLAGPSRTSRLTWLTEVPSHWAQVRLTLLARLGSGHTPSREHPEWWIGCTIPWITTGEVWQIRDDRNEYLSETREMISVLGIANSSAELHPAGTVVLSRTASAGYSAIMATDMATSQDYVTWTCGPRLRPRFLLLCLRAMRQDLLGRLAMGSTHQTIYVPDIQSIRVPLPPLEEQDQLVAWVWERLHRIDAAVDAIRRQIDLLAERRQALVTAAVTGQLEIPGVAA